MATLYRTDIDFSLSLISTLYYNPAATPTTSDTVVYSRNYGASSLAYTNTTYPANSTYLMSGWYSGISMYGGPSSSLTLVTNQAYTINSSVGQANTFSNGTSALNTAPVMMETGAGSYSYSSSLLAFSASVTVSNNTITKIGRGILNLSTVSGSGVLKVEEGFLYLGASGYTSITTTLGKTTTAPTSFASAPVLVQSTTSLSFSSTTVNNAVTYWFSANAIDTSPQLALSDRAYLRVYKEQSNQKTVNATILTNATLATSGSTGNIDFALTGSSSSPSGTVTLAGYLAVQTYGYNTTSLPKPTGRITYISNFLAPRVVGSDWTTVLSINHLWDTGAFLTFGGAGYMSFTGSGGTRQQRFLGLVLEADTYARVGVSSTILNLLSYPITRNNTRSVIQFTYGTGPSASESIQAVSGTGNVNGILGGWALYDLGAISWAVFDAPNTRIVGISSYYNSSSGGNTISNYNNQNVEFTTSFPTFSAANWNPNSIYWNNGNTVSATVTLTGSNTIQSGGFLFRANSSQSLAVNTLTGGTLTTSQDPTFYFHISTPSTYKNETLNINTVLTDNANPVSVVVTGSDAWGSFLCLNAMNTYSGPTVVYGGNLTVTKAGALGTHQDVFLKSSVALVPATSTTALTFALDGVATTKKIYVDSYLSAPFLFFRRGMEAKNFNVNRPTDVPSPFYTSPRNFNYATSDLTIGREMTTSTGSGVDPAPVGVQIGLFGKLKGTYVTETTYATGSIVTYKPNRIKMLSTSYFRLFGDRAATFVFRPGYIQAANVNAIQTPLTLFLEGNTTVVLDQPLEIESLSLYGGTTSLASAQGLTVTYGNTVYLRGTAALKSELNVAGLSVYVQNNLFGTTANPMTTVRLAQDGGLTFAEHVSTGLNQSIYFSLADVSLLQTNNGISSPNSASYILAQNTSFNTWGKPYRTNLTGHPWLRAHVKGKIVLSSGSSSNWTGTRTVFSANGVSVLHVASCITEDATGSYSPVFYLNGGLTIPTAKNTYSGDPMMVCGSPLDGVPNVTTPTFYSFFGVKEAFGVGTKTITTYVRPTYGSWRYITINQFSHNLVIQQGSSTDLRNVLLQSGEVSNYFNSLYGVPAWSSDYSFTGNITITPLPGASTCSSSWYLVGNVTATFSGTLTLSPETSSTQPSLLFVLNSVYNRTPSLVLTGPIVFGTNSSISATSTGPTQTYPFFTLSSSDLSRYLPVITIASSSITEPSSAPYGFRNSTNYPFYYRFGRNVSNLRFSFSWYGMVDFNGYDASTIGAWSQSNSSYYDFIALRAKTWTLTSGVTFPRNGLVEGDNGNIVITTAQTIGATTALFRNLTITNSASVDLSTCYENVTLNFLLLDTTNNYPLSLQGNCTITSYQRNKTANAANGYMTNEGSLLYNQNNDGVITFGTFNAVNQAAGYSLILKPRTTTAAPIRINNGQFNPSGTFGIVINPRQMRDIDTNGVSVDYPLIEFTSQTPSLSNFTLSDGPTTYNPTSTRLTKALKVVGNTLYASLSLQRLVWKFTYNDSWDLITSNWQLQGNPSAVAFNNAGECLLFDDTAAGPASATVSIATSTTVAPRMINFNNTVKDYTIRGNNPSTSILNNSTSSLVNIVKRGTGSVFWNGGTFVLSAASPTYSGIDGNGSNGIGTYIHEGKFIAVQYTDVAATAYLPQRMIYLAAGATLGLYNASSSTSISLFSESNWSINGVGGTIEISPFYSGGVIGATTTVTLNDILPKPPHLFSASLSLQVTVNDRYLNFVPPKNMLNYPGTIIVPDRACISLTDQTNYFPNNLNLIGSGVPYTNGPSYQSVLAATGLSTSYRGTGALVLGTSVSTTAAETEIWGDITLVGHTKISNTCKFTGNSFYGWANLLWLGADQGYLGNPQTSTADNLNTTDMPQLGKIHGIISGNFNLIIGLATGTRSSIVRLTNNNTYTGQTYVGDTTGTGTNSYYVALGLIVGDGGTKGTLGTGDVTITGQSDANFTFLAFHRSDTYDLRQNITGTYGGTGTPLLIVESYDVRTRGYSVTFRNLCVGLTPYYKQPTRRLTLDGGSAVATDFLTILANPSPAWYVLDATASIAGTWGPYTGSTPSPGGVEGILNVRENSTLTTSSDIILGTGNLYSFGFPSVENTSTSNVTINVEAGSSWLSGTSSGGTSNFQTRGSGVITLNNAGTIRWGRLSLSHVGTLYINQTAGSFTLNSGSGSFSTIGNTIYNLSGGTIGSTVTGTSSAVYSFSTINITGTVNVQLGNSAGVSFNCNSAPFISATSGLQGGTLNFLGTGTVSFASATYFTPANYYFIAANYANGFVINTNLTGSATSVLLGVNNAPTYVFNGTNTLTCDLRPANTGGGVRIIMNGTWGGLITTNYTSQTVVGGRGTSGALTLSDANCMFEVDGFQSTSFTTTRATIGGGFIQSSQPYLLVYNVKNTGSQRILNYTSTNISHVCNFRLIGSSNYRSPTITVGAGQVNLTYTVYDLVWSGSTSNVWQVGGTDANFAGSATTQRAGDNIAFDDTSSANARNIRLAAGDTEILTWASLVTSTAFSNYTNAGNITFDNTVPYSIYTEDSTAIAGPGSFTKNGSGTLTLAESLQNNYFTGGFNMNAGTVISQFRTALGSGDLNLAGGTLQVSDALSLNGTVLYLTGNFNWSAGTLSVQ